MQVDNQLLTFFNTDFLDSPREVKVIESQQAPNSESKIETRTSLEETGKTRDSSVAPEGDAADEAAAEPEKIS